MQSLADRFHDLVCLKLIQYHKNAQTRKRKTNPSLESEDHSDGEEVNSLGHKLQNDGFIPQNGAEDRQNNFAYHPTLGTSNTPSEDIIPFSIDQESTEPIAAAPASYLNGHNPMGATPTKLLEAELEFPNFELEGYMMEQHRRMNRTDSNQLDTNSGRLELLPSQARMGNQSVYETSQSPPRRLGQNERSPIPTTQNIKRPLPGDAPSRKTKRNKRHPDVHVIKPSLVVVLKLTRGKGVSNRPTTMPPQQPRVLIPSVEADEISLRHSSVPVSRHNVVASDAEIGDERTSIQPIVSHQDPTNDISEVAMDGLHNLNDMASAPDATGSTRPSSTMPSQPHVTQIQGESQAMAEFRKLWFSEGCEASELMSKMLTNSLDKHTPKELFDILLRALRQTHDQLPSEGIHNDSPSTSNDAQEQFTPQALDPDQQQSDLVEQNVPTSSTAHHTKLAEEPTLSFNDEKSHESPVATASRATTIEEHMNSGYSDPTAAVESLGEMHAGLRGGMIADGQLSKASPNHTPHTDMPKATTSKVARDADSTDTDYNHDQLVQHINLTLMLDRKDGSVPVQMNTIGIRTIRNISDLFNAIEERLGWQVEQDEEVFRAIIIGGGGCARTATDLPKIELGLSKGDTEDRSWDMWLSSLRNFHEKERVDIKMDLVAKVFVRRRSDCKG